MKIKLAFTALIIYSSFIVTNISAFAIINGCIADSLKPGVIDTDVVLPPKWAFGILYGGYTNQAQTLERINKIIEHNYPIDAYWIDSWFWSFTDSGKGPKGYIDFVGDTLSFPNRKAMWTVFQQKNIKAGFWIWDCIFEKGNETVFNDFEKRGYFKNVYLENGSWHNQNTTTAMYEQGNQSTGTNCGNINFNDSEAVKFFHSKVKHFFDDGADFIKLDRTSDINVCKTMFEITEDFGLETKGRGFILSHTGGMETDDYKRYPTKWTDDTRSDWTVENPTKEFNPWVPPIAFKENIEMFTNPKLKTSNIPFLTNDLGGFDMGKTDVVDEELYIRWMQFSMFTPIVEVFSQPENPTSNLAYMYSSRADSLFIRYSHLRMKLFPYIYSYAHQTRLKGVNLIRKIPNSVYEYFFGNELFIAPIYEQGAVKRNFILPEGKWFDFWNDEIYDGNKYYQINSPIDIIPVFVRAGAIIPMRKYSRSIEQGTNDTLIIHIYSGSNSQFELIEDDGISNEYLDGKIAMTKFETCYRGSDLILNIRPVIGNYNGMKIKRTISINVHGNERIGSVSFNNNLLPISKLHLTTTDYFDLNIFEESVINIKFQ